MSKEIVMACIKYCDRLYTGFNHTECFNKLNREEMIIVHSRLEEGFVDSDGNFVDRKQAMIIAKEANQVKSGKSTLMSEDLYLDWLKKQDKEIQDLNKALEMACERVKYFEEIQDKEMGFYDFFGYESNYDLQAIIEQYKQQAKEKESE